MSKQLVGKIYHLCLENGLIFAVAMWLLSRGVILLAMLAIAPFLPAPPEGIEAEIGWDVFSAFDSIHYQQIATSGYEYANDGKGYNVAFFPLFPLLIRSFMTLGLPFEVCGTLLNNLAFLGALIVLYGWVEKRHGSSAARWATAVLAWCPLSLFGTVIYTEGVFLLFSIAALRAFDRKQHLWAALWGALATATRITGLALIPTFAIAAWRERRSPMAYLASLATVAGVLLYILYCWIEFGEPRAFLLVQRAWQPEQAFWGQSWLKMLAQIVIGWANWNKGAIVDLTHPLLFLLICGIGYWLWRSHSVAGGYGFCILVLLLWILAGDPFVDMVMVLGGAYLLWYSKDKIGRIPLFYGLFSFAIIFSSGRTASAERYAYAIVSLSLALGVLLCRHPRWGYPTLGFFGLLLLLFAIRFSQNLWVA